MNAAPLLDLQIGATSRDSGKGQLVMPDARLDPRDLVHLDLRAHREVWVYLNSSVTQPWK